MDGVLGTSLVAVKASQETSYYVLVYEIAIGKCEAPGEKESECLYKRVAIKREQ